MPQHLTFSSQFSSGREKRKLNLLLYTHQVNMFQTSLQFDKYYTPLLCLLGCIGNSLSFLVFCADSQYRSQSSSWYLSALAISDTLYLFNVFLVWLESCISQGVLTWGELSCPLIMYIGQVACFMSVYLILAFSVERCLAVHFPLSQLSSSGVSKAKKVITLLTVVSLALFSYVWVIAKVVQVPTNSTETGNEEDNQTVYQNVTFVYRCSVAEEFYKFAEISSYVDTVVTFVLPFLIISFANVQIAILLWKRKDQQEIEIIPPSSVLQSVSTEINQARRLRKLSTLSTRISFIVETENQSNELPIQLENFEHYEDSQNQNNGRDSFSSINTNNGNDRRYRRHDNSAAEVRVTKTLLLVSSTFLLLNLPLHVVRCLQFVFVSKMLIFKCSKLISVILL